jgi:arylformamidase
MIHDLSPLVSPRLGVWPGDTVAEREVLAAVAEGNNYTLSTLRGTVHLGTHIDAPSHVLADGAAIHEVPLDAYIGPCQVLHLDVAHGQVITPDDLPAPIVAERVLLGTGTFPDPNDWNTDFASCGAELIDFLAAAGVVLVGIDTPSVDLFHSKPLPSHHAAFGHGMAVLEGLVLTGVSDGEYELVALPLRLDGFDASPVRAILRTIS